MDTLTTMLTDPAAYNKPSLSGAATILPMADSIAAEVDRSLEAATISDGDIVIAAISLSNHITISIVHMVTMALTIIMMMSIIILVIIVGLLLRFVMLLPSR